VKIEGGPFWQKKGAIGRKKVDKRGYWKVNRIIAHHIHVRKYLNETYYFVQLIYANKNRKNDFTRMF
jgi:hypothetical protein